ncbi:MAG: ATP-binding protein [Flavobacteriaceae bacterium]|nr:ATP-binding protein [Flavobacteriaceae bacterium]
MLQLYNVTDTQNRYVDMDPEKIIAISDRGKADYFHGRTKEINFVKDILKLSKEKKKGHSILIQGAPGVGKTALLRELEKIGSETGWTISKIEWEALWNVNELYNCLIDEKTSQEVNVNIKLAVGTDYVF